MRGVMASPEGEEDGSGWRLRHEALGKRALENPRLSTEIVAMHLVHRGFCGSPRIHRELRAAEHPVGSRYSRISRPRLRSRRLLAQRVAMLAGLT
jgi:hypothetical protein